MVHMFWVSLVDNFQILIALYFDMRIVDNLVFNNAARKVIKDVFKHARCIFVASYYTQVNLLPFYTQVLKLLIFYFGMQM
jgi:hypothetical protein